MRILLFIKLYATHYYIRTAIGFIYVESNLCFIDIPYLILQDYAHQAEPRIQVINNEQEVRYALKKVSCHTVDNSNAVLDLVRNHAP
jgi:hypothetical protein